MKKIFTLSFVALALSVPATIIAQQAVIQRGTTAVKTFGNPTENKSITSRASDDYEVYYPAPHGVFFLSLPMNNEHYDVPEAGVAPCNVDIKFTTDIDLDYNDYEWTYINQAGREVEVENEDITMNVAKTSVVDAPFLFAQGYGGNGTYTMARGGLVFGQGYYEDFYAGNINVATLNNEFFNVAALAVNYEEAGKNFADEYPLKISDVTIKAWGEVFRYGGAPYAFDAIRMALIFTGEKAAPNQVEADIYEFEPESKATLGKKLGTYVNKQIYQYSSYQGSYWNTIEFVPKENETAPVITSDVMVVFRVTEGTETIISPTMAGTPYYHESEETTSYVIADYTRNGNEIKYGCLSYVGEYSGRENEYCKHWTASGKINYDVEDPSGIDEIKVNTPVREDKAVYSISGVKVSDDGINANLPAGLYICNGKKIIVR